MPKIIGPTERELQSELRVSRFAWRRSGVLAVACAALALLLAPQRIAAAPSGPTDPGDGRVSSFYTWAGGLPEKPGVVLRTEPLPPELGLSNASEQYRILYTSTDGTTGQGVTPVSGALFIPKGATPKDGWPIVAWAHGTVGTADICAPSWRGRSYRDVKYLDAWLALGFAVVSTDYQGLGTPGPHPYLETRPAAYNVLDSIRAAQKLRPDLSQQAIIVGQSQGASAAFSAAAYWPTYAPELKIAATVVTGVPYFGGPAGTGIHQPNQVDPTLVASFYLVEAMRRTHPEIDPAKLYQPKALAMYSRNQTICLGELEDDAKLEGLTPMTTVTPELMRTLSDPDAAAKLRYPTLHLAMPLFVGTGEADEYIAADVQTALVKKVCETGSVVKAVRYPGLSHSETVNASLKDSVPFVRDALAGRPIASSCGQN